MLLSFLISLLGLAPVHIAIPVLPDRLLSEAENTSLPGNLSAANLDIAPSLNRSATISIDPRFSYDPKFAQLFLDKKSAYVTTVLALRDLSTKGWTSILSSDQQYSWANYGDVTIRIHATGDPSILQYRYAIWGLYSAIQETYAHGFRACVLGLYWSPIVGGTRHLMGYVSIIGETSLQLGSGSHTENSVGLTSPTHPAPPTVAISNTTTAANGSISLDAGGVDARNFKVEIKWEGRPINIDNVFHVVNTAIVYLSANTQEGYISRPGVIKDDASRTFLRWDSTNLRASPYMEYRHMIAALAGLAASMYEQDRFEEVRFILFLSDEEVGRGWLYQNRRGTSSLASIARIER